ncbi:MAG: FliA/WhiG family RNA polymerase sigma factor [Phycisphaerales bacterium]
MPTSVKASGSKRGAASPAKRASTETDPAPAPAKPKRSKKGFSFPPEAEITKEALDAIEPREIWIHFQKTKSLAIRNYFLERFMHLVRYNAERIHTRLPDEVDVDDLVQAGLFGLKDAIESFELDRGVKFETYCASRIRGAILDELRSMDWVPRLVRQRSSKVNQARNRFLLAHGRAPTENELADLLGADTEEYKKLNRDSRAVGVFSLSRKVVGGDSSRELHEIDVIRDDTQSNPLSEAQRNDLRNLITRGLSRAERLIIVLYYFEEMTMKEIGATLDLSESRVSQMHSSILARLKAQMQHREREFEPVEA